MAANRKDVDGWIEKAKETGAQYIISVCDMFEYDDYPVYIMPDESLIEQVEHYNERNMQKVNEVIQIRDKEGNISVKENIQWIVSQ